MKNLRICIVLFILFSGCTHKPAVPELFVTQNRIDQYISSGAYERDCEQIDNEAKKYLDERLKRGGKLAVVFDIDETSLSNWPAYKVNGYARILSGECDLTNGPCNIRVWQSMGIAKPILPTLELARYSRNHGVALFFVTGRSTDLREATDKNLRAAGYEWDGLYLLPVGKKFASAIDFKAPARQKIEQQGYTIVFTIGDQWSDLKGGFAERTFKLPNPVYYLP